MMGTRRRGPRPATTGTREARNPWDTSRVPGWSSSGGAAAAAARLVPVAIGSDGGGSTRLPACVQRRGRGAPDPRPCPLRRLRLPRPHADRHHRPAARDVRDAALVAAGDGRSRRPRLRQPPGRARRLPRGLDAGVEGMRFAWTDDFGYAGMYALEESPRVIDTSATRPGLRNSAPPSSRPTRSWEDFWPSRTSSRARSTARDPCRTAAKPSAARDGRARQRGSATASGSARCSRDHDLLLSADVAAARPAGRGVGRRTGPAAAPPSPTARSRRTYTSHTHMFNWLGFPAVSVPCGLRRRPTGRTADRRQARQRSQDLPGGRSVPGRLSPARAPDRQLTPGHA